MSRSKVTTVVTTTVTQVLNLLDIKPEAITVTPADEAINVHLTIPDAESGLLIGYHAEALTSLQRLVNLIVYHQLQVWHRLIININNYRETREQVLTDMAHNAADRVRLTHQEVIMPYLESFERRLIHLALANDPDVDTVSTGEDRDRRLVIRPKSAAA